MTFSKSQKERLLDIARDGVRFDELMVQHSAIRIGGVVDALIRPADMEMLKSVIRWAAENEVSYMFLGGGSDTLIRDNGIRGLVIQLKDGFNKFDVEYENNDDVFITAGAGVLSGVFVNFSVERGLSGVEGLAGIPGTIGGNIMTNAGTTLGYIEDVVDEITVIDKNLRELTIKKKALEFSYRKLKLPRSSAIVKSLLKLKKGDSVAIAQRIADFMEKRKKSQPQGVYTLGCVFKNPKINKKSWSAGELIEEAGLKGVRVGGARVSEVHGNFIVNEANATARDVEILIGLIKERVKEKFGIILDPEINIVGDRS